MMMNKKENDVVSFGNRNYDLGFTKYSRHTNPLAELHTLHVNANFTWRTCGLVKNSYIFSTRCISGRSSSVEKSSETNYFAEYMSRASKLWRKNFYVIGCCCVENRLAFNFWKQNALTILLLLRKEKFSGKWKHFRWRLGSTRCKAEKNALLNRTRVFCCFCMASDVYYVHLI